LQVASDALKTARFIGIKKALLKAFSFTINHTKYIGLLLLCSYVFIQGIAYLVTSLFLINDSDDKSGR